MVDPTGTVAGPATVAQTGRDHRSAAPRGTEMEVGTIAAGEMIPATG
jgi:hypothetical protein